MRTYFNTEPVRWMLVVSLLLFLFSSCQQHDPVSSESNPEVQNNVTILTAANPPQLAKAFETKAMIDDDGGSIVVGDDENGYSWLLFPEDAIDEDDYPNGTPIYFFWQSSGLFQAECYPEGIQFDEPVTIHLSYQNADLTGVNENKLDLYWYNPLTNQYESIGGTVDTQAKHVEGTITHFSRYAIGYE